MTKDDVIKIIEEHLVKAKTRRIQLTQAGRHQEALREDAKVHGLMTLWKDVCAKEAGRERIAS